MEFLVEWGEIVEERMKELWKKKWERKWNIILNVTMKNEKNNELYAEIYYETINEIFSEWEEEILKEWDMLTKKVQVGAQKVLLDMCKNVVHNAEIRKNERKTFIALSRIVSSLGISNCDKTRITF